MHELVESEVRPERREDRLRPVPELSIGDVAREFGVTFRALRFYESRGLIAPRREGSTRRYRHADRERLALILRGKKLGFTLEEIIKMICDSAAGETEALDLSRQRCVEQIDALEQKKRQIETALAELRLTYAQDDRRHYRRQAPPL